MKALRFHEYGGPEVLRFDEDAPVPEPGDGQIQVRVSGAGVNPVDWKVRVGHPAFKLDLPATVAWEFSGTVTQLGYGVTEFQEGDEVYGISHVGAIAEYTVAASVNTALKPVSMDLPDAAAVPLAGLTAWQGLFDVGGLETGQKVLIHAAAGGVGTFAVQLAKWKGATVIGTASGKNHHLLRELGADEVIDYTTTPFETAVQDVDVVLETIGSEESTLKSLAVLKKGGIMVCLAGPAPTEEAEKEGKRAVRHSMQPKEGQLSQLADLIQDLKVRPIISAVVPYREAIEAEKESEGGHVVGKLVVDVRR